MRPIPPKVLQEHGGVDHIGLGSELRRCASRHGNGDTQVGLEDAPPCFCGIEPHCGHRHCLPSASSISWPTIAATFSRDPVRASFTSSIVSARARRCSAATRPPPAFPGFPTLRAPPCACASNGSVSTGLKERPSGVSTGVRAPQSEWGSSAYLDMGPHYRVSLHFGFSGGGSAKALGLK